MTRRPHLPGRRSKTSSIACSNRVSLSRARAVAFSRTSSGATSSTSSSDTGETSFVRRRPPGWPDVTSRFFGPGVRSRVDDKRSSSSKGSGRIDEQEACRANGACGWPQPFPRCPWRSPACCTATPFPRSPTWRRKRTTRARRGATSTGASSAAPPSATPPQRSAAPTLRRIACRCTLADPSLNWRRAHRRAAIHWPATIQQTAPRPASLTPSAAREAPPRRTPFLRGRRALPTRPARPDVTPSLAIRWPRSHVPRAPRVSCRTLAFPSPRA